jgi:hypothetical protein
MPATLPCDTQPGACSALSAAASLLAAAALLAAAGDTTRVSVTVDDTDISVQVSRHAGDPAAREAAVAAYAQVLHTTVTRRPRPASPDSWCETRGQAGGHPVHVWTLIHSDEEA